MGDDGMRHLPVRGVEREFFIGTKFSILYTSMYSPAEAATRSCYLIFVTVLY